MTKKSNLHLIAAEKEPFYYDVSKKPTAEHLNIRLLSAWNLDLENLEESLTLKLLGVAQHNQLKWLQNGLEGNIPLHLIHEDGHTVLTVATQFGATDVAEYLLDLGLNPAFFAEKGMHYNSFFSACAGGQFEMASLLLKHPSKKVTYTMVEPRHQQSGLQVAVHNLQFDFAKQFIEAYPKTLVHLDRINRAAFATLLSIFVTSTFTYVEQQARQEEMDDFCMYMLTKENPFKKVSEKAIPSIQVILHSSFASFHQSNSTVHMTPLNAVRTILLACPKFGAALIKLAESNPKGMLEHRFLLNAKKHLAEVEQLRLNLEKLAKLEKERKS